MSQRRGAKKRAVCRECVVRSARGSKKRARPRGVVGAPGRSQFSISWKEGKFEEKNQGSDQKMLGSIKDRFALALPSALPAPHGLSEPVASYLHGPNGCFNSSTREPLLRSIDRDRSIAATPSSSYAATTHHPLFLFVPIHTPRADATRRPIRCGLAWAAAPSTGPNEPVNRWARRLFKRPRPSSSPVQRSRTPFDLKISCHTHPNTPTAKNHAASRGPAGELH